MSYKLHLGKILHEEKYKYCIIYPLKVTHFKKIYYRLNSGFNLYIRPNDITISHEIWYIHYVGIIKTIFLTI